MAAIDETFQTYVDTLTENAAAAGNGLRCITVRGWDLPDSLAAGGSKGFSEQDKESIEQVFDRTKINNQAVTELGRFNFPVIAALHHQGNVLGGARRDYAMRHATRVQLIAHASARRAGLGADDGPPQSALKKYVEVLLKQESE